MISDDQDKVVKTTTTESTQFTQPLKTNQYQKQVYTDEMAKQAIEQAKKSAGFLDIVDQWKTKKTELVERGKKANDNAKILAWGNLITNLAKIAGWGNAPVAKEDTGYLTEAFAQADKLRDTYYNTRDMYDQAKVNYTQAYAQNHRKAFEAAEQAKWDAEQKRVDTANAMAQKSATKTKTVEKVDPFAKAELQIKQKKATVESQTAKTQQALNEARTAKAIAEAQAAGKYPTKSGDIAYTYRPGDGKEYYIDKSLAQDISTTLKSLKKTKDSTVVEQQMYDDYYALTHDKYGNAIQKTPSLGEVAAFFLTKYPEQFEGIIKKAKTSASAPVAGNIRFTESGADGTSAASTNIDSLLQ